MRKSEKAMIVIAKATEDDFEQVCALDPQDPARRGFFADVIRAGQCLLAKIEGLAVGFAVLDRSFLGQHYISLLIVHPDYRRRGAAIALICHIESICPTEKLFTSSNLSNIPMQQVCKSLGFVRSGYIENLEPGDPEIIFLKRLEGKGKQGLRNT